MNIRTIKHPSDWLQLQQELGWTIVDENRCNEPIFDEVTGEQVEMVALTEYHLNGEDGYYAGVLQISVGNGWTESEFTAFTFSGTGE